MFFIPDRYGILHAPPGMVPEYKGTLLICLHYCFLPVNGINGICIFNEQEVKMSGGHPFCDLAGFNQYQAIFISIGLRYIVGSVVVSVKVFLMRPIFQVFCNCNRIKPFVYSFSYPYRGPYGTIRKDGMHMKIAFQG